MIWWDGSEYQLLNVLCYVFKQIPQRVSIFLSCLFLLQSGTFKGQGTWFLEKHFPSRFTEGCHISGCLFSGEWLPLSIKWFYCMLLCLFTSSISSFNYFLWLIFIVMDLSFCGKFLACENLLHWYQELFATVAELYMNDMMMWAHLSLRGYSFALKVHYPF